MKVVQLLSQIEVTGAEAYAITLSQWLRKNDHDVTIISNRLHIPTDVPFISKEIHTNSVITRWRNIFFLRKFIKDNNIQIVHCHSRAAVRVAYWATRGLPVAMISTVHGRQHSSFSKRLFDLYGDKIIGVCKNVLITLHNDFGMSMRKMVCLGNPVQIKEPSANNSLDGKLKIAVIARASGPKGQRTKDLIKKVFPQLLENFKDLQIDIIGGLTEDLNEEINHKIFELQKEFPNRLNLLGYMTNLNEKMPEYRLIMGSGRVAIEALARGITSYAIGENSNPGLVNLKNYEAVKASNFGDIGTRYTEEVIDYTKVTQELFEILNNPLERAEKEQLKQTTLRDFDSESICKAILDVYKSAYFKKLKPQHIPVLMYHKIPDQELTGKHRIFVTKDNFEKHLQFFQKKKITTISFQDLKDFRDLKRPISEFPKKPIIITFDDGYIDNLENAGPLLKKYNMKATIFLLADIDVRENYWDTKDGEPAHPIMSLEQKQKLKDYNFEIGSHGFSHKKITEMSDQEAFKELKDSKEKLERDFSQEITTYAFTYGITSERAAELARLAGYTFAVNTDTGGLHHEENPHAIFRVNIFPEDQSHQLRKKTASWYRSYYFKKRGK